MDRLYKNMPYKNGFIVRPYCNACYDCHKIGEGSEIDTCWTCEKAEGSKVYVLASSENKFHGKFADFDWAFIPDELSKILKKLLDAVK